MATVNPETTKQQPEVKVNPTWAKKFGVDTEKVLKSKFTIGTNRKSPYYSAEQWNTAIKALKTSTKSFEEKTPAYEKLETEIHRQQNLLASDTTLESTTKKETEKRLGEALLQLSKQRLEEEPQKVKGDSGDEARVVSSMRQDQDHGQENLKREISAKEKISESTRGKEAKTDFKSQAIARRKRKNEGTALVQTHSRSIANSMEKSLAKAKQDTRQSCGQIGDDLAVDKIQAWMREAENDGEEDVIFPLFKRMAELGNWAKQLQDPSASLEDKDYKELEKLARDCRNLAESYKGNHKGFQLTAKGKSRIRLCDEALKKAETIELLLKAKLDEEEKASAAVRKLANTIQELAKKEAATPAMVMELENLRKVPGINEGTRSHIDNAIENLRKVLQQQAEARFLETKNPTDQDRAEILLEFGGCKPPSSKGQSDSLFIKGPDGSNAFIFKPGEGEARNSDDWIEGGGAPREILASRLGDLFQKDLGIDFRIPRSTVFSSEDESFSRGSNSKAKKRTGALQTAVKIKPGDPPDAVGFWENSGEKGTIVQAVNSINPEDAESIAMLDFITLNGDRQSGNVLVQDPSMEPGKTRIVPIDAGQMLPTKTAFLRGCGSMTCAKPFDPTIGVFNDSDNMLMQLPGAQNPFSEKTKKAIEKINPDEMVESLRVQYADIAKEAPEMAGKVDESSFDLMKRSLKFLKKAAQANLTQFQISQVYATGFRSIVEAEEGQLDAEIEKAISAIREFDALGGEKGGNRLLAEMGFNNDRTGVQLVDLSLEQKLEILKTKPSVAEFKQKRYEKWQRDLADIEQYVFFIGDTPFKLTDELTRDYTEENYLLLQKLDLYKNMGGDARLKELLSGDDATFDYEARHSLDVKFKRFQWSIGIVKVGGYAAMRSAMGTDRFDKEIVGKPADVQGSTYEKFMKSQI